VGFGASKKIYKSFEELFLALKCANFFNPLGGQEVEMTFSSVVLLFGSFLNFRYQEKLKFINDEPARKKARQVGRPNLYSNS
jgi:hypothetical protein